MKVMTVKASELQRGDELLWSEDLSMPPMSIGVVLRTEEGPMCQYAKEWEGGKVPSVLIRYTAGDGELIAFEHPETTIEVRR